MWLFIAITFIIIVVLLISLWAYFKTFYNDKKDADERTLPKGEQYEPFHPLMSSLIKEMDSIAGETVSIRAKDGKRLCAIYYHVCDNAPVHIQLHGYKGSYIRDFCGGNKLARDMGHNTLVIYQRAHGKSDGHTISFGINERFDCLCWIEYVCKRFGNNIPIILSGVSMGAATVLMASELDLPENVLGIIADCPYSSPKDIISKVAKKMGYPANLTFPFIWLGGLLFGHFNILASSAISAVKNSKIPILIMHGEGDRFVPCDMSRRITASANATNVTLYTFPNAGHGMSYMTDRERYVSLTEKFIHNVISK